MRLCLVLGTITLLLLYNEKGKKRETEVYQYLVHTVSVLDAVQYSTWYRLLYLVPGTIPVLKLKFFKQKFKCSSAAQYVPPWRKLDSPWNLMLQRFSRRYRWTQVRVHSTTTPNLVITSSTYPSALTTVGHLLKSSRGVRRAPGLQSAMLWILRTCSAQDLSDIMNGTVSRRLDRIPPFNRALASKPSPLLIQVLQLSASDPDTYQNVLRVLSHDRLLELDLTSKCALVKALQMFSGRKYAGVLSVQENKVVTHVLKSVKGKELTKMKNMLNDVGTRFSLHQLMFQAMSSREREDVLQHFEQQQPALQSKRPIKVLSDIDDTLFSSWLDKRWPREIVYPGVRQFFVELTHSQRSNLHATTTTTTATAAAAAARSTDDAQLLHELTEMIARVDHLIAKYTERSDSADDTDDRRREGNDEMETEEEQDVSKEHALVDRFRLLRERSLGVWIHDEEEEEVEDEDDIVDGDIEVDFETVDDAVDHSLFVGSLSSTSDTSSISSSTSPTPSSTTPSSTTPTVVVPLDDVTYITARPHGFRGVVAALTRRRLRLAGMSERPDVMLGNIGGLLGNKRIAKKKFTNFAEFSMLFPEYDFVLCGDSGQGDAALGMLMQEHYPNKVRGIFIHNINDKNVTGDGRLKSEYEQEKKFQFFKTYVGSATQAYQADLMDEESVIRVANATLSEFVEKKFPKNVKGVRLKLERLKDLMSDLTMAKVSIQKKNTEGT